MVTTARQWKKASGATEVELPSGNKCLARRVDMRSLLNAGSIPNSLMDIVKDALKGKSTSMEDLAEEVELDPAKLNDMLAFMDQVVIGCVLNPKVLPVPMRTVDGKSEPIPYDERDEDKLYIDDVDEDDKQFIFNFAVGGTRDLERFREQQEGYVAGVHPGEGVEDSPQPDGGD